MLAKTLSRLLVAARRHAVFVSCKCYTSDFTIYGSGKSFRNTTSDDIANKLHRRQSACPGILASLTYKSADVIRHTPSWISSTYRHTFSLQVSVYCAQSLSLSSLPISIFRASYFRSHWKINFYGRSGSCARIGASCY